MNIEEKIKNMEVESKKRNESAKKAALSLFKIPEGFSSGAVEQMIDDIINAAVLEIACINLKTTKDFNDLYKL